MEFPTLRNHLHNSNQKGSRKQRSRAKFPRQSRPCPPKDVRRVLRIEYTFAEMKTWGAGILLVFATLVAFTPAAAQVKPAPVKPKIVTTQATPPPCSPGSLDFSCFPAPHPAMPWAFFNPNVGAWHYGAVVQYIPVPSQQVVIQVPVLDTVSPETRAQTVEIPGYYIAETTTGYWYPERWGLQQPNVGVYQWVKLPAEFRRK